MDETHESYSMRDEVKLPSNRNFGYVFFAVFSIIGLAPILDASAVRWWSILIAATLLLITIVAPVLFTLPNRLWHRFGLLLNSIVGPVALAILFFVVVTPMGWLLRILGKDFMRIRRDGNCSSYWIARDPPGPKPDSLNHQF
jgi:hypothetical protein